MVFSARIINLFAYATTAFCLISCGGGGGGGSSSSGGTASTQQSGNVAFVMDWSHITLLGLSTLNPSPGDLVSAKILAKPYAAGYSLAYDRKADELYVATNNTITVYSRASAMSGGELPSRTIVPTVQNYISRIPPAIAGNPPETIQRLGFDNFVLDKETDTLYLAAKAFRNTGPGGAYRGAVAVLNHASSLNGAIKPDRLIENDISLGGIAIDSKRNLLYTIGQYGMVNIFENLQTLDGAAAAVRKISIGQSGSPGDVAIDSARDRLYIADPTTGIHAIDQASKASGNVIHGVLSFGATSQSSNTGYLAFDPLNDRLYVGAWSNAYIINGASKLQGNQQATSSIATIVSGPAGSYITGFAFP